MNPHPPAIMALTHRLGAILGILVGLGCVPSFSYGQSAATAEVNTRKTDVQVSGAANLNSESAADVVLRLENETGQASLFFKYPAGALDLSAFRDLALKVDNQTAAELDILVTGSSNPKSASRSTQARFLISPGEQADLRVLMTRPALPGDHPLVRRLGNLYAFPWGHQRHWQHMDNAAIVRVSVSLRWHDARPGQLVRISRPFGLGDYSVDPTVLGTMDFPVVDDFGQARGTPGWPGKISGIGELQADALADKSLVAAHTQPANGRSRFGGEKGAPRHKATGFFRTEKIEGKWWFIDPDGHLFWSLGINGVAGSSSTRVKGRETLFPEAVRSRTEIDHYKDNVKLKHGDAAWRQTHADVTIARMLGWGFNTIGAWSEPDTLAARRVPYTLIVHPDLHGIGGIRKMVDPYAEGFRSSLDRNLAKLAATHGDSPWLVGVFIENELDWKGGITLAEEVLRSSPRTPARRALIALLQERYPNLDALNQAWGSRHESFDALRPMTGANVSPAYEKDLRDGLAALAETFFAACAAAMDKHFPNHLYLGCRFHVWNPLVTAAASRHCDVVSVNVYRYGLADFSLTTAEDKPSLVSEFHFGTRDYGVWGTGLASAADARNQTDLVRAYLSDALRHPNIVGAHWFQWSSQAVTGRQDGENFGVGLVSIVDRPVEPLVKAFSEVSAALYDYRRGSSKTRIGAPAPSPEGKTPQSSATGTSP